MMMVRMPVGLLSLLAGRPLLSRRRAAVLSDGRDRRGQHGNAETHTKKCADPLLLAAIYIPFTTTGQMRSQVLGAATGGYPCDGMPWPASKTVGEFEERASIEHVEPPPAQELLVSEVSRDANSATMLTSLGSTTE